MIFIDFHHQHYRGFLQTQYLTTTCFRMIRMSTFSTCWLNQQQRNGANRKSNWQTIEVRAALYQYVPMIYLYHRLEMVGACWSNPVLLTLVHSSSCEQHQSPPALAFPSVLILFKDLSKGHPVPARAIAMATQRGFRRQSDCHGI